MHVSTFYLYDTHTVHYLYPVPVLAKLNPDLSAFSYITVILGKGLPRRQNIQAKLLPPMPLLR